MLIKALTRTHDDHHHRRGRAPAAADARMHRCHARGVSRVRRGQRGQPAAHALSGQASRSGPARTSPTSMSARCRRPASPACAPARRSCGRATAAHERRTYENPQAFNWGFVILFSIETAEPLALLHEFELSGMRVGATTAVAVDAIARPDAQTLGLFGTGKQARNALEAIALVRPIETRQCLQPERRTSRRLRARYVARRSRGRRGGRCARGRARRRYRLLRHHRDEGRCLTANGWRTASSSSRSPIPT